MWATEPFAETEGIAGVTFGREGHRLVGTLYLARGEEPKARELRELIAGWLSEAWT